MVQQNFDAVDKALSHLHKITVPDEAHAESRSAKSYPR